MTRALAATERIQLGVAVANPLTRHYTVTASAAATLAQLHPGRVLLGLGRGDSAVRTLGLKQVATKKFAEVVPRIRALMAGEEIETDRVPDHGMPEELTRLVDARTQAYDYYAGHLDSSAEHNAWITPELIDDFAITGPPERCLERIHELEALGVDEISSAYLNGRI